ncbi:MAG: hypothetical protein LH624_07510 [Cryobacterium sp.]|nr:hypothetical protein [Cryobacterium sp.]
MHNVQRLLRPEPFGLTDWAPAAVPNVGTVSTRCILGQADSEADGKAYTVQWPQIIKPSALSGYADGTTMAGRIDPADKNLVAFGDKPFM